MSTTLWQGAWREGCHSGILIRWEALEDNLGERGPRWPRIRLAIFARYGALPRGEDICDGEPRLGIEERSPFDAHR